LEIFEKLATESLFGDEKVEEPKDITIYNNNNKRVGINFDELDLKNLDIKDLIYKLKNS
jgi:hypothetical protein